MASKANKARGTREFLLYCGCGGISSAADAAIYFPLLNLSPLPAPLCVLLGRGFGTLISFLLMKPFVFKSKNWSKEVLLPEFVRFITTRILAISLEVLFSLLTVTLFGLDGNWMRVISWTGVGLLNFISAKFLVFKYQNYRR